MSRSRFAAVDSCCRAPGELRFVFSSRASRKAPSLAAIVPRNHCAKKNVQPAKTRSQKCIAPAPRTEKRHSAEYDETESHQRNHADRKRAGSDNGSSVKQQPHSRNCTHHPKAKHYCSEQRARQNRRSKTVGKASRGAGEEGRAGSARFRKSGPACNP